MISIAMPFQPTWTNVLVAGVTIMISSEFMSHLYNWYFTPKKYLKKLKPRKFITPGWAARLQPKGQLEVPKLTEEELAGLNMRKPPEIWNEVLFFPDVLSSDRTSRRANMAVKQLVRYFDEAKSIISLCVYLNSNHDLTEIILKKYREGLLIQVVTDYDTWTAHNSSGAKFWYKQGIHVRMKNTGYLMHNKFAIIDDEAVLTGSLNWTRQGVQSNNENVLVSTDPQIVTKYRQEFAKLWNNTNPIPIDH
ncbi:unnamed protein product [Orchesella dallaii]|uniref:Mitochondrial cardiolipin hydrolase n=1 Tax=Orchesella dallaii TaxID=48710 RepID=A0ABP1PW99_9HEXA